MLGVRNSNKCTHEYTEAATPYRYSIQTQLWAATYQAAKRTGSLKIASCKWATARVVRRDDTHPCSDITQIESLTREIEGAVFTVALNGGVHSEGGRNSRDLRRWHDGQLPNSSPLRSCLDIQPHIHCCCCQSRSEESYMTGFVQLKQRPQPKL